MWNQNKYMPEGMSAIRTEEWVATPAALKRAMELGIILEAPAVSCDAELNLTFKLGTMQGIMSREEVEYSPNGQPTKDITILSRVGKKVCFKVIGFGRDAEGNESAILSRRAAQQECRNEYLSRLTAGDIIPARVTSFADYGAFIDVGCGIYSMLPISSIAVSRVAHPSDLLSRGMPLRVVVTGYDPVSAHIRVSHRELLGTWEENAAKFSVGQTVVGTVRSVEDYGTFIELAPNFVGLAEYDCTLKKGQRVSVYIKSVNPDRMKVKLAVIDNCLNACEPSHDHFDYYVDAETKHIDYWRYSPAYASRLVERVFGEPEPSLCA